MNGGNRSRYRRPSHHSVWLLARAVHAIRWDRDPAAIRLLRQGRAIPVCPEQLSGLPRPRITLVGGDGRRIAVGRARVMSELGKDVTESICLACKEIAGLAREARPQSALLKEGSLSCGATRSSRNWRRRSGPGVLTAVLTSAGIAVRPAGVSIPRCSLVSDKYILS